MFAFYINNADILSDSSSQLLTPSIRTNQVGEDWLRNAA